MGKYEEALERARAGKPMDEVFPELKESEDDEYVYQNALDAIFYQDCIGKEDVIFALNILCNLISEKRKVIPSCVHWKPSEEQMGALLFAMSKVSPATTESILLSEIYEQLKKLT